MNDVAYWIDPDGTAHDIGHFAHRRWISIYRGLCCDSAENAGWHRIRFFPGEECVTYGRVALTAAQREAVERVAAAHRASRIVDMTVTRRAGS